MIVISYEFDMLSSYNCLNLGMLGLVGLRVALRSSQGRSQFGEISRNAFSVTGFDGPNHRSMNWMRGVVSTRKECCPPLLAVSLVTSSFYSTGSVHITGNCISSSYTRLRLHLFEGPYSVIAKLVCFNWRQRFSQLRHSLDFAEFC